MPSSITLTVKNLASSTSFFLAALQPLNYIYRGKVGGTIGFGLKDSPPDFWICEEIPGVPAGAAHVAFPATSQKNVQEFFIAAVKAGGRCHGEPLLRDEASGYYSAAIIDFDGNSIEAVYRPDLLESGSDRSRPNSASSAGSVASKSTSNMSTKAPTMVSKATTAKPRSSTPTEARSVAPSRAPTSAPTQVSKAPTSTSRAPTQASKAPTSASRSPTQVSRTPTAVPTQVSRAPTAVPTSVSRAPTSVPQYQTQTVTHTAPTGEVITSIITEARNTINVARELVNHARPALDSSNSTPNLSADPQSHQTSDTIVGTLLGVAAGAALHYAYTKATESKSPQSAEQQFQRPPGIARTSTEPYLADGRASSYHNNFSRQPYAIEAPPTEYGGGSRVPSQRYLTMHDTDERLLDIAPIAMSGRPRRRSSFSGIDVRSFTSQSRASQAPKSSNPRMLEAPPTSYRAPTAITQADTQVSSRSRSSRRESGSVARAASLTSNSRRPKRDDGDGDGDGESRASGRTHRSSKSKPSSRAPSVSAGSDARTVVPIKGSTVSKATTAIRADQIPLPGSRAGTTVSNNPSEYHSTHSKSHKTVIGKMIERDHREGGRGLTKSVVGKIEDAVNLGVSDKEIDPSDSVSQVSSNHTRRSRRSR